MLRIYTAALDKIRSTLQGHTRNPNDMLMGRRSVRSAAFSANGMRVVTAGQDHLARIWDAGTGEELVTLSWHAEPLDSAFFSPDGGFILTRSHGDGTARIFDSATGKPLNILTQFSGGLYSAAVFNLDGSHVVTASGSTVSIWDMSRYQDSPEHLAELVRHVVPYRMTDQGVVVPRSLVGARI